jgi:hypothetical protein
VSIKKETHGWWPGISQEEFIKKVTVDRLPGVLRRCPLRKEHMTGGQEAPGGVH